MDPLALLSDDEEGDDEPDSSLKDAEETRADETSAQAEPGNKRPRISLDTLGLDYDALKRAGYRAANDVEEEVERDKATRAFNALTKQVQSQHPTFVEAKSDPYVTPTAEVWEAAEAHAQEQEKAGLAQYKISSKVPTGPPDLPTGVIVVEQRWARGLLEQLPTINSTTQVLTHTDQSSRSAGYSVVSVYGPPDCTERAKGMITQHVEQLKGHRSAERMGCEEPPEDVEVVDDHRPEKEPLAPWSTWEQASAGLGPKLYGVLETLGFVAPTPIQAHSWPVLCAGRDLIGVAKTGSGKTLAFLLPCFAALLHEGLRSKTNAESGNLPVQMSKEAAGPGSYSPEVLVLAPSRELASQIEMEARRFSEATKIVTLATYGGAGMRKAQLGELRQRPECVVGTVGRLRDFIEREAHWFSVRNVRWLIMDEADMMLGEGLSDGIRQITTDVESPRRQTMMFSATFASDVRDLASWVLRREIVLKVGLRDVLKANKDVEQKIMIVKDDYDKDGALKTILRRQYSQSSREPGKTLVFACDPDSCDVLYSKLKSTFTTAEVDVLHGNRPQTDREKAMADFKSGACNVLIATNIASRGLDVKDIKVVINYDPPEDPEDYVHRIGRTGRAGRKGTAISLLRRGPDGLAMIYITKVMKYTGVEVPVDLIDALKKRRGRDASAASEALEGIVKSIQVQRSWATVTQ